MVSSSRWRRHAQPIIAKVIAEVGTSDRKALKAALAAAYPFGPRQYHPYKIWCHEIRVQLGEVKPKGRAARGRKVTLDAAGQGKLFE